MKKTKSVIIANFTRFAAKAVTLLICISIAPSASTAISLDVKLPSFDERFYEKASQEQLDKVKAHRTQSLKEHLNTNNLDATHFTSGTGFFVDYNHIVTNEHVVRSCDHVRIRGAVRPSFARVYGVDRDADLALLRTNRSPTRPAPIRNKKDLEIGDNVTVMGYPLDHGITGDYVIKEARVTDMHDSFGNPNRIQFTDSVEKGNSGGPLLDHNGSVVGVIVGKMNFFLASGGKKASDTPIKTSSVAISLPTLKNFLDKYHIQYKKTDLDPHYSKNYMEKRAKDYIVNIHCVKTKQQDAGFSEEHDKLSKLR